MSRLRNPFQVTRLPVRRGVLQPSARGGPTAAYVGDPGSKAGDYMEIDAKGRSAALELAAEQANAAGRKVVIFSLATAIGPEDAVQRLIRAVRKDDRTLSWKTVIQDVAAELRFKVTISPSPEAGGMPEITLGLDPGVSATHSGLFTDALDTLKAVLVRRRLRLGLGIDEFSATPQVGR